jgi:hypothetical protein
MALPGKTVWTVRMASWVQRDQPDRRVKPAHKDCKAKLALPGPRARLGPRDRRVRPVKPVSRGGKDLRALLVLKAQPARKEMLALPGRWVRKVRSALWVPPVRRASPVRRARRAFLVKWDRPDPWDHQAPSVPWVQLAQSVRRVHKALWANQVRKAKSGPPGRLACPVLLDRRARSARLALPVLPALWGPRVPSARSAPSVPRALQVVR